MRSIRRSLIVWFVLLFGVALAAVAATLDHLARKALDGRSAAAAITINQAYTDRAEEDYRKFDTRLLVEARTKASQMQSQYAGRYQREFERFQWANRIAEGLLDTAPWQRLMMQAANQRNQVSFSAHRAYFSGWFSGGHLDDDVESQIERESPAGANPYPALYQINIESRVPILLWRSESLGAETFPVERNTTTAGKLFNEKFDELTIRGERVRRVVFSAPMLLPFARVGPPPRGSTPRPPRSEAERGPNSSPTLSVSPSQFVENLPKIYVHAARSLEYVQVPLAALREERDADLVRLAQENRDERFLLRATVFGVGLVALGFIVFGGRQLVRRGLLPIQRLSVAVSEVSERDFRLPVRAEDLSEELLPIHARLTDMLAALRRAFDREKQAVADISHELRTPVAALLTTLEVSLRKTRTADDYKRTLEECRAITKQLGQLVERVMTLAYLDAGQTTVTRTLVDARELAEGCACIIRPLAEAHGVAFQLIAGEPVELKTDRDKLREVLMNLLHNAVEYTNAGGRIDLEVSAPSSNRVAFVVRDTGIGMNDDVKDKIFERFYRADPSRTATGVHAGLGLAIVKEYLSRLEGTVAVESAPGRGTTFRVELPTA